MDTDPPEFPKTVYLFQATGVTSYTGPSRTVEAIQVGAEAGGAWMIVGDDGSLVARPPKQRTKGSNEENQR